MKETALHDRHTDFGAKMTNFNGWDMPLKFTRINKEHQAVRKKAGIFDISHMGEIYLEGDGALEFISEHCTQDIVASEVNQCKYAHILNEEGGILDDTIVTKLSEDSCYIVPNAGNDQKIYNWLAEKGGKEYLVNVTKNTVMLALQGPKAEGILNKVANEDVSDIEFFRAKMMKINDEIQSKIDEDWPMGDKVIVQRSGYTGEDGFELALSNKAGVVLWSNLLSGEEPPARCGLGARDTLRLEAGFLLSGQDFDEDRTTIETGWEKQTVDYDHGFLGKKALENMKEEEHQMLKGIEMVDQGIPRTGCGIFDGDEQVGKVTSGTHSPSLKKGIAMGYLDPGYHEEGTEVKIKIRDEKRDAEIKNPPFIDLG